MVFKAKRNKYGVAPKAARTWHDGTVFDSKGEMQRWAKLLQWQLAGHIRNLRRQVEYPLIIPAHATGHGESEPAKKVGVFTADFVYERRWPTDENAWQEIIEEFKGVIVRDVPLRHRLFEALYGKTISVVKKA